MIRFFLAACALSFVISCTTTKPWQRKNLAHPTMKIDGDKWTNVLRMHYLGTREGAVGGLGGAGGGCGCN